MKHDTDEIKRQYDQIVFELKRDLRTSAILRDIAASLSEKYVYLLKSCSSEEVFNKISKHHSFFDYDIIQHIIQNFGSKSFKKNFQTYKNKFQEFAKRRICKCPSDAFGEFDDKELVFGIETTKSVKTFTLEELKTLKSEMVKILGYIFCRFLKLNVKEDSMEFIFRAMEDISPVLTENQKIALRRLGITSIIYGNSAKTNILFQATSNEESLSG